MTLPHLFTIFEDVDCEHSEFERSGPEESDWLGAAPADGTTLIEFAQDGTGASFCLLQRMGVAIDQAPVVYLGSEGDVTPVAVNPEAFLDFVGAQLTLTAYDDEPELHDELEDEEDEDERNGIKERRAKVRRAFERHEPPCRIFARGSTPTSQLENSWRTDVTVEDAEHATLIYKWERCEIQAASA